jgi:DNA-binding MarR family transcriptional regulator
MSKIIQDTKDYLEKIFGDNAYISSWNEKSLLPNYLRNSYDYCWISFLNTNFLLIISEYDKPFRVSESKKHIEQLKKYSHIKFEVVFVFTSTSNYQRNQLVKEKISFIVPHKHLYVPFLGVAFSEWFSKNQSKITRLSPAGQALFFELITPSLNNKSQTEIGAQLGLGKMSISRAFQELESLGVVNKDKFGRVNRWKLTKQNSELWDTIEHYLFNPVISKVYVSYPGHYMDLELIEAGETALAESTMLGFPMTKTYAISKKDWQKTKNKFHIVSSEDDNACCIEIWKHKIPIYHGKVNPLALYVTLKDSHDERIQMCIEDLKVCYPWEDIMYD